MHHQRRNPLLRHLPAIITIALGVLACAIQKPTNLEPQTWWEGRGPVVPHDSFPADCTLCHEGDDWRTIRADFAFDHEAETGVRLEGAHAQAECLRCHNDRGPAGVFAARGCSGCHEDVHRGQLGRDCSTCHDEDSWGARQAIADHARTRFPLVGSHAAVDCWRCHPGAEVGSFSRASIDCIDCHADVLAMATNPDHLAQGWTSGCDRCHIPTTWGGGGFNHGHFALTGKHKTAACSSCHAGNVYVGTPTDCFACHQGEYNAAQNPNHVALGISTQCQQCHSTSGWLGARFNHVGIANGCVTCHQGDYNQTTNPNHVAAGFPTTCEQCHNTNVWVPAMFNHSGIMNGCVTCHQTEYNQTTQPNHATAGIPTTCEQCHSTNAWLPATFNHAGIMNGCVQCHLDDYNTTTQPNHQAAMFGQACEQCHTTNKWVPANFNHTFPITSGAHKNFQCIACHTNTSNYKDFTCFTCHEHNQSQMNKDHKEVQGYVYTSQACFSCHPNGKH